MEESQVHLTLAFLLPRDARSAKRNIAIAGRPSVRNVDVRVISLGPSHSVSKRMRLSEPTTKIGMKTDTYYQPRRYVAR